VQRLSLAFRCFWLVLTNQARAEQIAAALKPPESVVSPADPLPVGAIQLLSLLQREGRLIDFLNEDITAYGDAQIGAAVRDIHRGCRQVLDEYVQVKPIVEQEEESRLEVPVGFDPAEIRLTGNVHGEPPFHGTLKHHGWMVGKIKLPEGTASNQRVVAPAEVEV
jgi:Domain of unknown function (DUF2760)